MTRHSTLTLLAAIAFFCAGSNVASAQERPPGSGRPDRPPAAGSGPPVEARAPSGKVPAGLQPARKLCFWQAAEGRPFATGRTCAPTTLGPVGSQCACRVGGVQHAGKIISAPRPGQSEAIR
jgi:hypothetical protein